MFPFNEDNQLLHHTINEQMVKNNWTSNSHEFADGKVNETTPEC